MSRGYLPYLGLIFGGMYQNQRTLDSGRWTIDDGCWTIPASRNKSLRDITKSTYEKTEKCITKQQYSAAQKKTTHTQFIREYFAYTHIPRSCETKKNYFLRSNLNSCCVTELVTLWCASHEIYSTPETNEECGCVTQCLQRLINGRVSACPPPGATGVFWVFVTQSCPYLVDFWRSEMVNDMCIEKQYCSCFELRTVELQR